MKLSELIYETCKSTIYYENNNSITRQSLREYAYSLTTSSNNESGITIDTDYKRTVDNVFDAVNKAIQRVADLEKLPFKIVEVVPSEIDIIDLKDVDDFGSLINVFYFDNDKRTDFTNVSYSSLGNKTYQLFPRRKISKVYVEYAPNFKWFTYEDIAYHNDDDIETDNDVDLNDLGISNKTASYIMLYAKGTLGYDIYGSQANGWVNQAESYFLDLADFNGEQPHYQQKVEAKFKIWSVPTIEV